MPRKRLRRPDYDYSQAGTYFVTVCVQHHRCLFGEVVDGVLSHNAAGEMVAALRAVRDANPELYAILNIS
jgi:hypothetical protein